MPLDDVVLREVQAVRDLRNAVESQLAHVADILVAPTLATDMPMLGAGLGNIPDLAETLTQPVSDLSQAITAALEALEARLEEAPLDGQRLETAIQEALKDIAGVTPKLAPDGSLSLSLQVDEMLSRSVAFAENLGLGASPLLDIDATAEAELSLAVDLTIDADFSDLENPKVALNDTGPTAEFCIKADANLQTEADLGVVDVEFDAETQSGGLDLCFELNVGGGAPEVTLAAGGMAGLTGRFTTVFADGVLPSITADLSLDFGLTPGVIDLDSLFTDPSLALGDITVDAGSVGDFLRETFGEVVAVLDTFPFGEVIDFLTTPVPIISEIPFGIPDLDGIPGVTVGDLVPLATGQRLDLSFVKLAADLIEFGNALNGDALDPAQDFSIGDITFDHNAIGGLLDGDFDVTEALKTALRDVETGIWNGLGQTGAEIDEFNLDPDFSFPLLSDPLDTAVSLLLSGIGGGVSPVELFMVDLPPLGFSESLSIRAPLGPFFVGLEGEFSLTTDFAIGYDSLGLFGDGTFAEGFYLEAQLPSNTGIDNPILNSGFFLGASGGIDIGIAEAGLRGGVRGEIELGVNDPNDDGLTRLSELANCLFDEIGGRLGAVLDAVARIGIGPFSFTVRQNLFDVTIAQFNGATCSSDDSVNGREVTNSGLAEVDETSGALILNVGGRADQRKLEGDIDVDDPDIDDGQSPARHEVFRISLSRDDDGNVISNEVVVAAFGVFERYSTKDLTRITGDFTRGDDVLIVDPGVQLALNIDVGANKDEPDNDSSRGGDLGDIIRGGTGGDDLAGRGGIDLLFGEDGGDLLNGGELGDLLDGGKGQDTVDYSQSTARVVVAPWDPAKDPPLSAAQLSLIDAAQTSAGAERVMLGSGGDAEGDVLVSIEQLIGSPFDDILTGDSKGDNLLDGNDGDDMLFGGDASDLLVGGRGADLLDGGGGDEDWTSYAFSFAGVGVNFAAGTGTGGEAQGDTYQNLENVVLSAYDDWFLGNADPNTVLALEGDDVLLLGGGADSIDAGPGGDIVFGQGAGATLSGGGYLNTQAGEGGDVISYAFANPVGVVPLTLFNTRIDLDTGLAQIGFLGVDVLADGLNLAADGTETVANGYNSFDDVEGTSLRDLIIGDAKGNRLSGNKGDDEILAGGGFDTLIGGEGADSLNGGFGIDWGDYSAASATVGVDLTQGIGVGAEAEGDTLAEIENLVSGRFNDVLRGSDAPNVLDPGLYAAAGREIVLGEGGVDTLRLIYDNAADAAQGFVITLDDQGGGDVRVNDASDRLLVDIGSTERLSVVLGEGVDLINTSALNEADNITTAGGTDIVFAGLGADMVRLGDDNDVLVRGGDLTSNPGAGADADQGFLLDGGAGFDFAQLDLSHADNDIIIDLSTPEGLAAFQSGIRAGSGFVRNFEQIFSLATGSGDDDITLTGDFNRTIQLGAGNNRLKLEEGGEVVVTALDGADVIQTARFGDASIAAGAGNDVINPGLGDNLVIGGDGGVGELDFDTLRIDYTGTLHSVRLRLNKDTFTKDNPLQTGSVVQSGGFETVEIFGTTLFSGIERFQITGSGQNDSLDASIVYDPSIAPDPSLPGHLLRGAGGEDIIQGGERDDLLYGGLGRDTLIGNGGDDFLSAGVLGIEGGVTVSGGVLANGDYLDGGFGSDTYVLGDSGGTHYGIGDETTNDYARIRLTLVDKVQLAGNASDYTLDTLASGEQVIRYDATGNIVAVIEGIDLGGFTDSRVAFEPIVQSSLAPVSPSLAAAVEGDVSPSVETGEALVSSLFATGNPFTGLPTGGDPTSGGGVFPDFNFNFDPDDIQNDAAAFIGVDPDQANDALDILGLGAIKTVEVVSTTTGFGAFAGNLDFADGPKIGFVLSTGRVGDISGENTEAGDIVTTSFAQTVPLEFEALTDDGVAVAQLPSLANGLRSITFNDDNDREGGGNGRFTGFDLDAVFLSRKRLTADEINEATELNGDGLLPKLDLFDFSPGGLRYTPGDMRLGTSNNTEFHGVINGLVQGQQATLDTVDYLMAPDGVGVLTLGDGGRLELELTQALDTISEPLYLYTVEAGDVEALVADITASEAGITPVGDLSTDLGLPGTTGDRSSLSATFASQTASDGATALFDVVILTEELPEFGGADLTDRVSVKINGVEALTLSDGRAATLENLAASPFGGFHPDLVLNLPGTGPLSDRIKADAYTKVLTVSAPVLAGDNTLEIVVEDGRDGLLDTAVVVLPLSTEITVLAGTDAGDQMIGDANNDDARGGFGDDIYTLTPGEDRFDGGVGVDTARVMLAPGDVSVNLQNGVTFIKDGGLSTELRNVEFLEFDNDGDPIVVNLYEAQQTGDLPIIAQDDSATVEKGQNKLGAFNVFDNDLDLGGDTIALLQVANGHQFAVIDSGLATIEGDFGSLSIGKFGEVGYELLPDFHGRETDLTDVFTYVVTDGKGYASATLTIRTEANPDVTAPIAMIDPLKTGDTTPELTGTVDDPSATVTVIIDGDSYKADNRGDGTWVLKDDTVNPLAAGPVKLEIVATDDAGNSSVLRDDESIEILPNAAPKIALSPVTEKVDENTKIAEPLKVADVIVTDDGIGDNKLTLEGADAGLFDISGTELFLRSGVELDHEAASALKVRVEVDDATVGATPDDVADFALTVNDVNEAPEVALTVTTKELDEDADTSRPTKVADIIVTDDALGDNKLILEGEDAGLFDISGTELFLRSGVELDHETASALKVRVEVDDATVGATPDDFADFALTVNDVNDAPEVSNTIAAEFGEEDEIFISFDRMLSVATDVDTKPEDLSIDALTCCFDQNGDEIVIDFVLGDDGVTLSNGQFQSLGRSAEQVVELTYDVSDGVETVLNTVSVTISGVNDAPEILSTDVFTVQENQTDIGRIEAFDIDAGDVLDYRVSGGADAALFQISDTGALSFVTAQDFDAPGSADCDRVYEVQVAVSDGAESVVQTLRVDLTDVDDGIMRTLIQGNDGSNVLTFAGTGGAEFVSGGGALDRSYATTGADLFVFGAETGDGVVDRDLIYNFDPTEDALSICGVDPAEITTLLSSQSLVVMSLPEDGDLIYVFGQGLNPDDFVFV